MSNLISAALRQRKATAARPPPSPVLSSQRNTESAVTRMLAVKRRLPDYGSMRVPQVPLPALRPLQLQ
jgi:hypothetical protein